MIQNEKDKITLLYLIYKTLKAKKHIVINSIIANWEDLKYFMQDILNNKNNILALKNTQELLYIDTRF